MSFTAPNDVIKRNYKSTKVTLSGTVDARMQLIAVDTSAGTAFEASDAAARRIVGVNEVDTGVSGDVIVVESSGTYRFKNSATAPLAAIDLGAVCYAADSVTVAKTTSHSLIAGTVVDIDTVGVWVEVGSYPTGATS